MQCQAFHRGWYSYIVDSVGLVKSSLGLSVGVSIPAAVSQQTAYLNRILTNTHTAAHGPNKEEEKRRRESDTHTRQETFKSMHMHTHTQYMLIKLMYAPISFPASQTHTLLTDIKCWCRCAVTF